MNIRDAIAAGLDSVTDKAIVITTDVAEVDAYGRQAHYAGRTSGYRQGFNKGILTGAAMIAAGVVLGLTVAIVSEAISESKNEE